MAIEIRHHAANGALDQFGIIDRIDIVPFDPLHDLGKQARLLPSQVLRQRRLPIGHDTATEGQSQTHDRADNYDQNCSGFQ